VQGLFTVDMCESQSSSTRMEVYLYLLVGDLLQVQTCSCVSFEPIPGGGPCCGDKKYNLLWVESYRFVC
jgi:hypothetical protein